MRARTLVLLLLVCRVVETGAAIRSEGFEAPRSFGYVIGDKFRHLIRITLDHPWALAPESLPETGRVSPWLELRHVRIDQRSINAGTSYELELGYQIFNAAKKTIEIFPPRLELSAVKGSKQVPVFIREWGFTLAPLTPGNPQQSMDYLHLQPVMKPFPQDARPGYALFAAGSAGLLFSLAILGYLFGTLQGIRRTRGPFARAFKQLRAMQKRGNQAELYPASLRRLHRVFNETAGRVLLNADLDRFFSEQPGFEPLRAPIEQLFDRSRNLFFEHKKTSLDGGFETVLRLCRQCRDVERGLS